MILFLENIGGVIFGGDLNTPYIPYENHKNRSAPVGWDSRHSIETAVSFILRKDAHYFLCLSITKYNSLVMPLFQLLTEKLGMYKGTSMILDFLMLFILHQSKTFYNFKIKNSFKNHKQQDSQELSRCNSTSLSS